MKHFYSKLAVAVSLCCANATLSYSQSLAEPTHPVDGWDEVNRIPATYYEDLMTNNTDIKPGHCWTVQVETNTNVPGWYRFQPYTKITDYVPRIMEETDDTYLYINATDPEHVYVEEFDPYSDGGEYDIVNLVPENGWTGGEGRYGTLADDVISFSPRSFAVYDASYELWYEVSRNTGFKLVLNEAEAKDYSVSVSVGTCTSYEEIAYKADCGNDVWDVKAIVMPGEFKAEYYQKAASEGEVIDTQWRQYVPVTSRGLYTVVVAGVDRQGNMVSCDYDYGFNVIDNDTWIDAGTTMYTEDFCASRYLDIEKTSYEVPLEMHPTIKGYFRIVDPYSEHPVINYPHYQSDHSHNHYIYINATDVRNPYIESSPIGVNLGYGDMSVTSAAGRLIAEGKTIEEVKASGVAFGSFDAQKNLTFPAGALLISEKGRDKGDWRPAANGFSVNLPVETTGIDSIDKGNDSVRIYTLQGTEVTGSASLKGVYIEVSADGSARKVVR